MPSAEKQEANTYGPPDPDNICAAIITIGRDNGLGERISTVLSQLAHLIIINNSPDPGSLSCLGAIPSDPRITIIHNPKNNGQSGGLNQAFEWAERAGFKWALILDDDTTPSSGLVSGLIEAYDSLASSGRWAAIGAAYEHRLPTMRPPRRKYNREAREVTAIQASGALVPIAVWRALGQFDERYFIGLVDYEFCLRARANGYRVAMSTRPLTTHAIGAPSRHRFLWRHVHTFNPAPWRVYLGFRNFMWMSIAYARTEPKFILAEARNMAKALAYVVLYEKRKWSKLIAATRGLLDGLHPQPKASRWPS